MGKAVNKCIECNVEKPLSGFAIKDFGLESSDMVEYDEVCRECCAVREKSGEKHSTKSHCSPQDKCSKPKNDSLDEGEEYWESLENLAMSLAMSVGGDLDMLRNYDEQIFLKRIKRCYIEHPFDDVVERAVEIISEAYAMGYEEVKKVSAGTYVVFGDSCGSYAEKGVVRCIENMCDFLNAKPIHIGNLLDHHGLHSKQILKMKDLTVVGNRLEMYSSSRICERNSVDFVRGGVEIAGSAMVRNQYYRCNPYTVGPAAMVHMEEKNYNAVIMNLPLLELHTQTKNDRNFVAATVGCACKKHERKNPLKRIAPTSMEDVLRSFPSYFKSGARQKETNRLWRNGLVIVHADDDGHCVVIPCEIKKTTYRGKSVCCTSYYDMIVTEDAVIKADTVGLAVGDVHVPMHDPKAIDVVDQIAKRISPDYIMNVGDHINCNCLNHHKLDRSEPLFGEDIATEFGNGLRILKLMAKWAPERHYIMGNHERFVSDFAAKNPQLESLLNILVLSNAESGAGYKTYKEKSVVKIGDIKYLHGEMRKYGASGDPSKKNSNVFDTDTVWGHCHRAGARLGSYSIGFLGQLDQCYNEPEASNWVHGFGVVAHFSDIAFVNTVYITDYTTFLGETRIQSREDVSKWELKELDRVVVDFKLKES